MNNIPAVNFQNQFKNVQDIHEIASCQEVKGDLFVEHLKIRSVQYSSSLYQKFRKPNEFGEKTHHIFSQITNSKIHHHVLSLLSFMIKNAPALY